MSALTRDIGDGYTRIRMTSPSELVVNAWLLQNDGQAILFDTGFPHTTDQLEAGLREVGLEIEALDGVVYTHTHIDHMGGGVALNDRLRGPNYVWEGTHPRMIDAYYDAQEALPLAGDWIEGFLPNTPSNRDRVEEVRSVPEGPIRTSGSGRMDRVERIALGQELHLAGRRFRCIDARGHDIYHASWLDIDTNTLISGDVILRVPTPIMPHMYDNLFQWLETLDRWQNTLDSPRMLPGHGLSTALFDASIERSRLVVQRLYEATQDCVQDGLPVDPVTIIEHYSGHDRSRYAQRFAVQIATLGSLLHALESRGYLRSLDSRHWVEVRTLPPWEALLTWPVEHTSYTHV